MASADMLTDIVFASGSEGEALNGTRMSRCAKSTSFLYMSSGVVTQSKDLCAFATLEGLCVRFEVLAGFMLAVKGSTQKPQAYL